MAGVVDEEVTNVVIKKEIESTPESPEQAEVQESPSNQAETNGSQKYTKVWSENETKHLLQLHKNYVPRFQNGNYSKKQLLEDVAQELNLNGYDATPEKVRNKMKHLKTKYRGMLEYNASHVRKKLIPFQDELAELYNMPYFDDEPVVNGNGSSDLTFHSKSPGKKRPKPSLKSILARKKSSTVAKASKIKKIVKAKRTAGQPLFQCGLCFSKFQSSAEMHVHSCKTSLIKMNHENRKRSPSKSIPQAFHWNSLLTMQFLDILKDYQESSKSSNLRKGNIWENISMHMKRLGNKISPAELSNKWRVLSTNYIKTVAYNKTHKDKKKCAFYKRLMDLHNHHSSFNCFNQRNQTTKRTVQVSPFSFSQGSSTASPKQLSSAFTSQKMFQEQTSTPELIAWLNNTWTEYKEIERKRQEAENQRHNEIMEMLSYLIESKDKQH